MEMDGVYARAAEDEGIDLGLPLDMLNAEYERILVGEAARQADEGRGPLPPQPAPYVPMTIRQPPSAALGVAPRDEDEVEVEEGDITTDPNEPLLEVIRKAMYGGYFGDNGHNVDQDYAAVVSYTHLRAHET